MSSDPASAALPHPTLRIGVSSCLLGEEVRYDGQHARSRYVTDHLARFAEFVSVCPELDAGLGTPRPALRIVRRDGESRLETSSTGEDLTERFHAAADARMDRLDELGELDGYVVKKSSPSCGMERVKIYAASGGGSRDGVGLFTARLRERYPLLPVEEEGRLNDPVLRERFLLRAWSRRRWRAAREAGLTRSRIVAFHTAHKLLVRTHDERAYRSLGRLVASFGEMPDAELFARYGEELQQTLAVPASRGRHVNALQHALGYLKDALHPNEKQEILTACADYQAGIVPLIVPVAMIRAHVRTHRIEYLLDQVYFDPYPKELALRSV